MENTIKVIITPEHFSQATNYIDNCPLEVSLKSQLPESTVVSVGASDAFIEDRRYNIPDKWGKHYSSEYTPFTIEDIINKSKISLEDIPTVEFELTIQNK